MADIRDDKSLNSHWLEYKSTLSRECRDNLFNYYFPNVRESAKKIAHRLPNTRCVDVDDLEQEGSLGLLDAFVDYDLSSGVKFWSFARHRVIGNMKDYLRQTDFISRLTRAKTRSYSEHNLLDDFGSNRKNYRTQEVIELLSLDEIAAIIQDIGPDPTSRTVQEDVKDFLLKDTNPIERKVMFLYYYDELTQLEIGKIIGLSEPSISRIRAMTLDRLRKHFLNTMSKERLELLLVG